MLFSMHRRPTLFGPARHQMVGLFQHVGSPLPAVGVLLSGLAEFGGGILLILGLLVPVAGLLLVNARNVDAAEQIRNIPGPRGAGVVLDCVGVQATVDLGAKLLGRNGVWTIVGLGGGHHDFHHGSTPCRSSLASRA
jgi:hypothetical protein